MIMRNQEISSILKQAGNNTSYLWDLPRPQWKDIDFYVLNNIKRDSDPNYVAPKVSYYTPVEEKKQPNAKMIKRVSDNKEYKTIKAASLDNHIYYSTLVKAMKGELKYRRIKNLFEYV